MATRLLIQTARALPTYLAGVLMVVGIAHVVSEPRPVIAADVPLWSFPSGDGGEASPATAPLPHFELVVVPSSLPLVFLLPGD